MEPHIRISINSIELPTGTLSLDLKLDKGDRVGIIGENGVGKTSLFRECKNLRQRFNNSLSFVDQENLVPMMDFSCLELKHLVETEVELPFWDELVKKFDFQPFLDRKVKVLSGGENQLFKIILGLSQQKDFYFLDEPFQYLSEVNSEKLRTVLENVHPESIFFIIDHHKKLISEICNKVYEFKVRDNVLELIHV